jgi:hypothetical protein
LIVVKPDALPVGQCIDLNRVTVTPACPVGFSTVRSLSFRITARTLQSTLQWRRAAENGDVFDPSSGTLAGNGQTEVTLTDIVLDDEAKIAITDGSHVLLRFTVRHH